MNDAPRNGLALALLGHLCAAAVAAAFLYAPYNKLIADDPRQFVIEINNYRLLPKQYANLFAIVLPWWEIGAAAALLVPATRRAGAILMAGMLVMFLVALGWAVYHGYDIRCGCFGKESAKVGWKTIGLDAGLLAATAAAFYLAPRRRSGSPDVLHVAPAREPA